MHDFDQAKNSLKKALNIFDSNVVVKNSNSIQIKVKVFDEAVNVILLKTSLTGSDRANPQIRVFTDKFLKVAVEALSSNERYFCFAHCSTSPDELKFSNITASDYLVSLEADWTKAGDRIDIRSIYNYLEENQTTKSFFKVNQQQHTATSILQAAFFTYDQDGISAFQQYLQFFDSRVAALITPKVASSQLESSPLIAGTNKIYFGAPGTGKSYKVRSFIQENGIPSFSEQDGHLNVFRTTLHPEYSYYDFVGQTMPVVKPIDNNGEPFISYDFVAGTFTKALKQAFSVKDEPVFLILEEMSRSNVSAVFGDLFQLLDRNIITGKSEYQISNDTVARHIFGDERNIYIPSNMFIVGTVNTNDQNVFVMDTAFKRRFEFEYLNANKLVLDSSDQPTNEFAFSLKEGQDEVHFEWCTLFRALNAFITKKEEHGGLGLKEDKQLGQFFIQFKENDDSYNFTQIKGKLLHYLYEDIEATTYSSVSIFHQAISSFSDAYEKLSTSKNIFSKDLVTMYQALKG